MVRVWAFLVAGLVLAGCGGGTEDGATTTISDSQGTTTSLEDAVTMIQPADDGGAILSASAADRRDAVFATSEMTALFGEEAILDEADTVEGIGQLVCVWSTIEDPNNTADLSYDLLILQLYLGDPVPGENFFDPSFYPDAQPLDGIGDQAFLEAGPPTTSRCISLTTARSTARSATSKPVRTIRQA
jgi:hypothetical protein